MSYFLFATVLAFLHSRTARALPRVSALRIPQSVIVWGVAPGTAVALCVSLYFVTLPHLRAAGNLIDALSVISAAGARPRVPDEHNALLARGLEEFKTALARGSFADQEIREQLALMARQVYFDERASPEVKRAYAALAETELQRQVAEHPGQARMHAFLGLLYRTVGETEQALEQLALTEALAPRRQHVLFDIGFTHIARAEYEQAKAVFKKTFELAPEYEQARLYYLISAIYAGDDALVATLSAPPYAALYRESDLVVQSYYAVKNYEAALSLLDVRIQKNPADLEARVSRATIQHESGNTAAAIMALERVIADFPEFKAQAEQFIAEIRR